MHQFAVVPFLRVSCAPLGVAPILADIRADANAFLRGVQLRAKPNYLDIVGNLRCNGSWRRCSEDVVFT
jgi:hypothetical protein